MTDCEIWRDIPGYEGLYQVSNLGRVRSLDRYVFTIKGCGKRFVSGEIKKPTQRKSGYLKTGLYKEGKSKTREVQRLVAEAFIDNPLGKTQVNHIDGDKTNNCVSNLEWVTPQENTIHSFTVLKRGLRKVHQCDLDGNIINTFDSVKEASERTNVARCSISNVIHGRRNKAGGYVWRAA